MARSHAKMVKSFVAILLVLTAVTLALAMPSTVEARNCGKVAGAKIVTQGRLSCKTARRVYRRFKAGKLLPRGWACGLSAGSCTKGNKNFTFRFN